MAKVCYFTGRRAETGNARSHAMNASRRTWKPNLRTVKADINGEVKKIHVCAKCLKNGKVKRA